MANGSENIEARLAAYIEGDLPDSERGAIEQYLAQNPAHRQLIEDLRGQKRQLSSLPRERAPAEVLDHLQSHLERQALLENVEDAASSMHINRWPQWTAVAAMLLLAVGLGFLVVQVLPGGNLNREQVAIAPPSVQQLPEVPALGDEERADRSLVEAAKRDENAADPDAKAFVGKGGFNTMSGRRGDDFVDKIASDMSKKSMDELEALALNNGSAIVVNTDDPLITQNLLASYLGRNEYAFKPVQPEVALNSKDVPAELKQKLQQEAPPAAQVQQQAIGSVVEKVNQRPEELKFNLKSEDAYLVVKNVSTEQAQSINRLLNEQRAGRQNARYYSNFDLYPELQDQRQRQVQEQITLQANAPLQEGVNSAANVLGRASDGAGSAPGAAPAPNPAPESAPNTAANVAGETAPANAGTQASTQPSEMQQALQSGTTNAAQVEHSQAKQGVAGGGELTDVLIVVRAEPAAAQNRVQSTDAAQTPAVQPTDVPAPGTTQPTDAPIEPIPTPATLPSTQPSE